MTARSLFRKIHRDLTVEAFLHSDAGALAGFKQRERRRISVVVDDVEPESKKMSPAERLHRA